MIQPGTQGLMFTGNEKVWPFHEQAVPAPRGHKVPVPGDTEGTKMVMDLLRDAGRGGRRRGPLRDRRDQPGGRDAGAVVGSRGGRFDETGVSPRRSVVIAAGGFVMNPDMVAEHTPALA